MYALAFDLEVAKAQQHHPVGATRAYYDIRSVLTEQFSFEWTQGSLYVLRNEDMSILFRAIYALTGTSASPGSERSDQSNRSRFAGDDSTANRSFLLLQRSSRRLMRSQALRSASLMSGSRGFS